MCLQCLRLKELKHNILEEQSNKIWEFYLYLIIRNRIVVVKIKVIPFARTTGMSLIRIPYINHKKIPVVNIAYIPNDKSLVCFSFIVFIACGKNEIVVQIAATNPSKMTNPISTNLRIDLIYIFITSYI